MYLVHTFQPWSLCWKIIMYKKGGDIADIKYDFFLKILGGVMVINRGCSMLWRHGNSCSVPFFFFITDGKYYTFGNVWLVVYVYSWDGVCSGRGQHSAVRVGTAPENEHRRQEEHLLCHHVQSGLYSGILEHVCSIFPFCFKYLTITDTYCKN